MRTDNRAWLRSLERLLIVAAATLPIACAVDNSQGGESGNATENAGSNTDASKQGSTADESKPYLVECGQVNEAGESFCYVDRDTYIGWRTYHGFCHVCHAQDAVGSTFAPSLLDRMRESDMTRELFLQRVNDGFTGQVGVMPPWKDNPNVRKQYNELYAYLMARASGDLKPGRPKRKPASE